MFVELRQCYMFFCLLEYFFFPSFSQVQLGLGCFKRLSSALHVISSLGCEAVKTNVELERPNRSGQRSHRPRDKSQR